MKKLLNQCKSIAYLLVLFCAIASNQAGAEQTAVTANQAEQNKTNQQNLNQLIMDVKPITTEPKTADEAMAVANQYNAISNSIKANQDSIVTSGNISTSFDTTVMSKLKSIIQIIEVQRKNLVGMIMNDSVTNTSDTKKLDSIIHALDEERTSLSSLITGEIDSVADQQKTVNNLQHVNTSNNQFSIFNNH